MAHSPKNCCLGSAKLDIGVLGYIGIVQHKEHSPDVVSIPPGTSCTYIYIYIYIYIYSLPPDDGLQICPKHGEVE